MKATPIVPIDPQEEPVNKEIRLETIQAVRRKYFGVMIFSP